MGDPRFRRRERWSIELLMLTHHTHTPYPCLSTLYMITRLRLFLCHDFYEHDLPIWIPSEARQLLLSDFCIDEKKHRTHTQIPYTMLMMDDEGTLWMIKCFLFRYPPELL
jgi:hypothetical protein